MNTLRIWATRNAGVLIAAVLLAAFYGLYVHLHSNGFSASVTRTNANQGFALALVAMAQALPILTGGIDLSVGSIMVMSTCLASVVVNGSPLQTFGGVLACLGAGLAAGLLNGCVVVYGRLQPLIVTLATSGLYLGIAMFLRPAPGGEVDLDLSDAVTGDAGTLFGPLDGSAFGGIPVSLALLLLILAVVWWPFRSSKLGRGVYAVGSAENAAYLSGVPIARSKIAAYALAGLFASVSGLFIGFLTGSGDAKAAQAGVYTLNSIAAVVIGGNSLAGGTGGLIGPILGAFVLRTITSLMRVTDTIFWVIKADPLIQPLFEGVVLLLAVTLGAARVFRVRNRLDLFR